MRNFPSRTEIARLQTKRCLQDSFLGGFSFARMMAKEDQIMYQANPFNPYQVNPAYANQITNNLHAMNQNQIIKVNGRGGAEAYQMPPNSQVLLLDETQPILWLKQTDGAGYPSLNAYDISPHTEKPAPDVHSLEERISRLEEAIKNESHNTNNGKRKSNDGTGKADDAGDKILR